MTSLTILRATRPGFLILAPLCALLGILLAVNQQIQLAPLDVLLVMAGALLAHAAVNLINEYEDFHSGLDKITQRTPFSGGSGALPAEPAAAPAVLGAGVAALGGVVVIGGYFLLTRGWPVLAFGAAGLVLVVAYTRWITRSAWLCLMAPGLGFGFGVTLGGLVALGGRIDPGALVVAVVVGLLVSELLLLNQLPDCEADRQVGRRHLPILIGLHRAARLGNAMLLGSYAVVAVAVLAGELPMPTLLVGLTLPGALWLARQLPGAIDAGAGLEPLMGLNVVVLLGTLALLAAGLWLG